MNKNLKFLISLMMLTAAMLLSAPIARADALSVTFTTPVVNYIPGSTATVSATVKNIGSDIAHLNGDSFNLSGPFTVDDTPFFTNAPLSLNPGQTATFDILDLLVGPNAGIGFYSGTFDILGDTTGMGGSDILNAQTASFQVQVVPEPASIMLLGSGLTGLVGVIRRKRL